jgi:hypothetical protein
MGRQRNLFRGFPPRAGAANNLLMIFEIRRLIVTINER